MIILPTTTFYDNIFYDDATTSTNHYVIINTRWQGKTLAKRFDLEFKILLEFAKYYKRMNHEDREEKMRKWKRLMRSMCSMETIKCLSVRYKPSNKIYQKRKMKR